MAEQNSSYPMISEKNWWTLRERFKASMPAAVSPNYVKTLLTMSNDNSANSNVISPLKRMGIIDDENKPTALANEWRLDDKYKDFCDKVVRTVYPTELLDLFPDSNVDKVTARSWFMSQGVGQAAADKMVSVFSLLKSGEIKEKKISNTKKENVGKKVKVKSTSTPPVENVSVTQETANKSTQYTSSPNLHIDLQIHISPDFSLEQIDAIFASMAKHLYGVN